MKVKAGAEWYFSDILVMLLIETHQILFYQSEKKGLQIPVNFRSELHLLIFSLLTSRTIVTSWRDFNSELTKTKLINKAGRGEN